MKQSKAATAPLKVSPQPPQLTHLTRPGPHRAAEPLKFRLCNTTQSGRSIEHQTFEAWRADEQSDGFGSGLTDSRRDIFFLTPDGPGPCLACVDFRASFAKFWGLATL